MIDPLVSLSYTVYSNPKTFALLLGSGISRPAGILTGWEIVLDLIKRLAALDREDVKNDPERWYTDKFNEEPNYSKLLKELLKSPTERKETLRSYFEQSEKDIEDNNKLPTKAHRSIANLIKLGFLQVIITTNFDKLLERAIEDLGVNPNVISTADSVNGALPLTRGEPTIIKVNGDYLDIRIKNTPEELKSMKPNMKKLVKQVFDEYGLIVCGWSADWDFALRDVLSSISTRRYTTYWSYRGTIKPEAQKLIDQRKAEKIRIKGADSFFIEIEEKIKSLIDLDKSHPLTLNIAIETIKRHIENGHDIRIRDMIMAETNNVFNSILNYDYPSTTIKGDTEGTIKFLNTCNNSVEVLASLVSACCYWKSDKIMEILKDCLEKLINLPDLIGSNYEWAAMRLFPAVLITYTSGIILAYQGKHNQLRLLLYDIFHYSQYDRKEELISFLFDEHYKYLFNRDYFNPAYNYISNTEGEKYKTPSNCYIYDILKPFLEKYLVNDITYQKAFDRFELIKSLSLFFDRTESNQLGCGPIGCFMYREHHRVEREIYDEAELEKDNWSLLKANFFDGKHYNFQSAWIEFVTFIKKNYPLEASPLFGEKETK